MPSPRTYPDSPTLRAVSLAGGVAKAATLCGVSRNTAHRWCAQGFVTHAIGLLRLAKLAGVDPWTLAKPEPIKCPQQESAVQSRG